MVLAGTIRASVKTIRMGSTLLAWTLFLSGIGVSLSGAQTAPTGEDVLVTRGELGGRGGRLVASLRTDPKTLNPVTAVDVASEEVIALLCADLIHINMLTQGTEPALAKSWKVSPDGKRYTLELRRGIRFSDGQPFDADDVVFSFKVYLDEHVHSPQRDLLEVGGEPIRVSKLGPYRVVFELAQPYAAAERLFDSVSILPRHLLEPIYEAGEISQAWTLATNPSEVAGLGPFRMKEYVPGQRIVLERNPFYWKTDFKKTRLPYLDEIVFLIVPTQDSETIRFQSGDLDVIDNISAENYEVLEKGQRSKGYTLFDLGPGFEYDFLFFNLNDLHGKQLPEITRKQEWFRRDEFRQAISAAIDRDAIVRLVYHGYATPLWGQVTPANKMWIDSSIPHPARSLTRAAALLESAGFSRQPGGSWVDAHGKVIEFSILTSPSNAQRTKMATIVQDDLTQLGLQVYLVPLEFQAVMSRVFETFDYDASVLGLVSGDADPNPEINIWRSEGGTHIWAPNETHPLAPWQTDLDRLMLLQTTVLDRKKRKAIYDQVQELVAQHDPVIFLISPDILVGAKDSVGGLRPAVMRHHLLWNAEQLFLRTGLTQIQRKGP